MFRARLIADTDPKTSIVPPDVDGYIYTPEAGDGKRVLLLLDEYDKDAIESGLPQTVTDLLTGEDHRIVNAPCGWGCACGAAIAKED